VDICGALDIFAMVAHGRAAERPSRHSGEPASSRLGSGWRIRIL